MPRARRPICRRGRRCTLHSTHLYVSFTAHPRHPTLGHCSLLCARVLMRSERSTPGVSCDSCSADRYCTVTYFPTCLAYVKHINLLLGALKHIERSGKFMYVLIVYHVSVSYYILQSAVSHFMIFEFMTYFIIRFRIKLM